MSRDAISGFLDTMRAHGLEPAEDIIADGELHRVRWVGDKTGTQNGAYVLHLNGHPAGFSSASGATLR
jgi:putative DNA primase/helicase